MAKARKVSKELLGKYVVGGAIFAGIPIPGIHSVGLTMAEAKMAAAVARTYGIKPVGIMYTVIFQGLMTYLGGSLILKGVGEAIGVVPILGWIAKPFVAGATIKGMGELIIAYFEERFPGQKAYHNPSCLEMFMAFGGAMAFSEFKELYDASYGSSN